MDDERGRAQELRQLAVENERAQQAIAEIQQQFETLIEIMIAAGTLKPGHQKMIQRLRQRVARARTTTTVALASDVDKHAVESDPIDCASLLHLCHGRCCSFSVVLSRSDVQEGQLEWDIDQPYRLARSTLDGYCNHLSRDGAGCQRYEHRPATCRSYSCKDDKRVWIDFDAQIPAPLPLTLIPPQRLTARR